MMNGRGKNNGHTNSNVECSKELNLHYQFFPEDRITTVYFEDPLPCPKKPKKRGVFQRKKCMARRLLRSERTILRKEWKNWQRQLLKQSQNKSTYLQPISKNLKYNRNLNISNKTMPALKRPLGEMSVPELVKYKNDLNNYLQYVSNKNCSSNGSILRINSKSEKTNKLKLPKAIKSFISLNSIDKEDAIQKHYDPLDNVESGCLTPDDKMGEQMEIASALIAEGIGLLNAKGINKSPSGRPNIKELSQLIRKLRNFQRTFEKPIFISSSKSLKNKVVSAHAPPSKLNHPTKKVIEPRIKAYDFPFDKICTGKTEDDGMPWVKDTMKNSKKVLKKNDLLISDIAEMKNTNLTCDSKVWLKIENLLDDKNNVIDLFVEKVLRKLRTSED